VSEQYSRILIALVLLELAIATSLGSGEAIFTRGVMLLRRRGLWAKALSGVQFKRTERRGNKRKFDARQTRKVTGPRLPSSTAFAFLSGTTSLANADLTTSSLLTSSSLILHLSSPFPYRAPPTESY
jgi:hypothetical protein